MSSLWYIFVITFSMARPTILMKILGYVGKKDMYGTSSIPRDSAH